MFQSIRHERRRNRNRQAGAAMLSFLALLSLGGASLLSGGQAVEVLDVAHIELVFDELADMAPPPPPLGVENGATEPEPQRTPEPEPEVDSEPDPEPQPEVDPEPEPASPATADLGPAGDPEGHKDSQKGGVKDGTVGGTPGGTGTRLTPGGAGTKTVSGNDLRVKRQVQPKYPAAAKELGIEGSCSLRFWVDARGRVSSVDVVSCPTAFQDAALTAAEKWSFYPYKDSSGTKHAASFVLRLEFRLE